MEIFIVFIALAFAIFQIILLVKIWNMTNNVKLLKDEVKEISQKMAFSETMSIYLLSGNKEGAFNYIVTEATKLLDATSPVFVNYYFNEVSIYDGPDKDKAASIIAELNNYAKALDMELPTHLQSIDEYIQYRVEAMKKNSGVTEEE